MAIFTTSLSMTSVPAEIISTGTTWASLRGASITNPIPVSIFNDAAGRVYLGGTGLTTATSVQGFPLLSSGTFTGHLLKPDAIFGVTSAGVTATLRVMAGMQTGGAS